MFLEVSASFEGRKPDLFESVGVDNCFLSDYSKRLSFGSSLR